MHACMPPTNPGPGLRLPRTSHLPSHTLQPSPAGRLTLSEVKGSVVSFLQQKRSMALTVRAVRSLTTSLQVRGRRSSSARWFC